MESLLIFIILMAVVIICVVCFYMFKIIMGFFGKVDCATCSPDGDCPLDRCDLEDPCDESCEGCKNYNPEKNSK